MSRAPEEVMKACQVGVPKGRKAYDELHSLLAECYGTIGALLDERSKLSSLVAEARSNDMTAMRWLADARIASGDNGQRMLPEFIEFLKDLRAKAEAAGPQAQEPGQ